MTQDQAEQRILQSLKMQSLFEQQEDSMSDIFESMEPEQAK